MNYYIDTQTKNLTRTDVIVDYLGEQFVIDMKVWHDKDITGVVKSSSLNILIIIISVKAICSVSTSIRTRI